jgi:hypothetical protein
MKSIRLKVIVSHISESEGACFGINNFIPEKLQTVTAATESLGKKCK